MGKCNKKYWETKNCLNCNSEFDSLISRSQRFCCGKCSSNYTANDKARIDKIKQTKLQRYGDATYVNPQKAKQTCLKKYGVDNVSKTKQVKDKINQSMTQKFGGHFFTTDEFKTKTRKTLGVDNVSQLNSTKQKVKKTVQEKYGVDNVFQSEDVKLKIKQNYIDKHGVEYPSQVPEIQNKKLESIKRSFFKKLQTNHKLNLKVEPLFSIDEYISTYRDHKYKFKCLKCETEFYDHIDGGHLPRCTNCYPLNKGSICETEIVDFLKSILDVDDIHCNRRDIISGEIDIFIESKQVAIEYDSFYFHSHSHVGKNYHLDKTKKCEEQNIQLIHIFEDEWINKQEIVKSKLQHILKLNVGKSVYARDCIIKEISPTVKNEFLEKYHIQGQDKSKIKLGAFHDDILVAVMTFSENRVALGNSATNGEFELSRFATSINVTGVAGKLFKHFTRKYDPNIVISYADRRFSWNVDGVYKKIGFEFEGVTAVNYWYFKNGYHKKHHRFNFRKSVLRNKLKEFDSDLTEYENMQLNGYDRIFDCGNLKYIWRR